MAKKKVLKEMTVKEMRKKNLNTLIKKATRTKKGEFIYPYTGVRG